MRTRPVRTTRKAFTLLEMVLAAAVAVLLLSALYVAMDLQLRHAENARDVVVETALARTLLSRITSDITPTLGQADPTRFTSQSGGGGQMGGGGAGGTGATGGGASGAGAAGGSNAGGGNSSTTGGAASSSQVTTGTQNLLVVQGDANSLTLFVSRPPPDANSPLAQQVFSDQRRIVYWLSGGSPGGLARQELLQVTSTDAANGAMPADSGDPNSKLLAPEVKSLQFQYFDGSEWQDSWDGTQPGADGVTPIGPPLGIAVTLGIARPDGEVKTYRHVVAIPAANNPTSSALSSGGQSSSGTSNGTSGP